MKFIFVATLLMAMSAPFANGQVCSGLAGLDSAECKLAAGSANISHFNNPVTLGQLLNANTGYPNDRILLTEAKSLFLQNLSLFGQEQRALAGLTLTAGWLMKGQLLLGNDKLVEALRMRFPNGSGVSPPIGEEINTLSIALTNFESGLAESNTLMQTPGAFGPPNFSDLSRLISRTVTTSVAKADRQFALAINDSVVRSQAEFSLRQASQRGYLGSAILAAAQTPSDFSASGGERITTGLGSTKNMFDLIAAGTNSQGYHKDYIPYLPYFDQNPDRSLRTIAQSLYSGPEGALYWDTQARNATRQVDQNETALTSALAQIRTRVIATLFDQTGVNPNSYFPNGLNLEDETTIQAYINAAMLASGQLGQEIAGADEAEAALQTAYTALQNIPKRIQIEQDRTNQTATVIRENGQTLGAYELTKGLANAFSFSNTWGLLDWGTTNVTFNPGSIVSGWYNKEAEILRANQQATIIGIDSAAQIKLMLLEMAEHAIALRQHEARLKQSKLRVDHVVALIRENLVEWKQSLAENADAYWTDPGYRLEMENAVSQAYMSLRNAQEFAFLAGKAIGYDWADTFPGDALLGAPYSNFLGPEDVFTTPNATGVGQFLTALGLYNTWNLGHHGPAASHGNINDISIRQDLLGYDDFDPNCQCFPAGRHAENVQLFKDFIRDHRENGVIQFDVDLSIAGNKLLPISLNPTTNYWNVKLEQIGADWSGSGLVVGPALNPNFSVALGGMSTVRNYRANWQPNNPANDVLVQYDLEAINSDGSLRVAGVQPSLNGFPVNPHYSSQLARLSVAATRWTIYIDTTQGDNVALNFNNLEDITLRIVYQWGQPNPYPP